MGTMIKHTARSARPPKVLSLFGALPACGIPDPATIARLEALLAEAKAGAIAGLAYAYIGPATTMYTGWVGQGDKHLLLAGIDLLHHRALAAAASENE